jgi:hypothetical protein
MTQQCTHSGLLLDYLYGELSESQSAAFTRHVRSCTRCMDEAARLRRVRSACRALSDVPDEPALARITERVLRASVANAAVPAWPIWLRGRARRPVRGGSPALLAHLPLIAAALGSVALVLVVIHGRGGRAGDGGIGAPAPEEAVSGAASLRAANAPAPALVADDDALEVRATPAGPAPAAAPAVAWKARLHSPMDSHPRVHGRYPLRSDDARALLVRLRAQVKGGRCAAAAQTLTRLVARDPSAPLPPADAAAFQRACPSPPGKAAVPAEEARLSR